MCKFAWHNKIQSSQDNIKDDTLDLFIEEVWLAPLSLSLSSISCKTFCLVKGRLKKFYVIDIWTKGEGPWSNIISHLSRKKHIIFSQSFWHLVFGNVSLYYYKDHKLKFYLNEIIIISIKTKRVQKSTKNIIYIFCSFRRRIEKKKYFKNGRIV